MCRIVLGYRAGQRERWCQSSSQVPDDGGHRKSFRGFPEVPLPPLSLTDGKTLRRYQLRSKSVDFLEHLWGWGGFNPACDPQKVVEEGRGRGWE